ncbi:hypothetical protein JYU34_020641 [Plutella xylostella]|uniref:Reverse transcriptase domain-containing protein n=1 Tax=Plutella xylostella TaxID=51655 RepID=A0ABQ7PVD8_PLUXY|nr:hypothetical protein JYU34_020641 [Plutella xylostella]
MSALKIATWNINGLTPNKSEVEAFINVNHIDILLISETHFKENTIFSIPRFNVYHTNHPDGTAHGGTAVLIKSCIKHYPLPSFCTEQIQASTVAIQQRGGYLNVSSVYCPPKHKIDESRFKDYLTTLGPRFIAGGDWNAKHTHWGSRLITTRGRELKKSIDSLKLTTLSSNEPTHWPTDPNKRPDLIDFFVIRGLSTLHLQPESSLDGSSNHTPVILTLNTPITNRKFAERLYNEKTDWDGFRNYIEENINLKMKLKNSDDIEVATRYITNLIQNACWRFTHFTERVHKQSKNLSALIKNMILEKRRLRRIWHNSRHPDDKTAFNKMSRELKEHITELENKTFQSKLESLTAKADTNYSLWKATKNYNKPHNVKPPIRDELNQWARTSKQKADAFAAHLAAVFVPNRPDPSHDDRIINETLSHEFQLELPVKSATPSEVRKEIRRLENGKAPGYDLIDKKVLLELPKKAIVFLTVLFNRIFYLEYFPKHWKVSQIIMIHKYGKPEDQAASYRPISLLPIMSKLLEKLILSRIRPILEGKIVPEHQFGFRQRHSTVEQVHRVCDKIRKSLEQREYCSSAFLDIQQAFDRVWHKGLLCKIKMMLPHNFFGLLESYLSDRLFQVRESDCTSGFYELKAGVPQGSVLGPVLYTIYTADLPETPGVTTATFADDTALLASDRDPIVASEKLQEALDSIDLWLKTWRISASASKSTHITFTLRKENCPPVSLGNQILPHKDSVKYLGMQLDRKLLWNKHIKAKRDEVNKKFKSLYWLLGKNSKLSLDNKLLVYNTIIKPIWTYGIQLWGSASISNINIIQRAQNAILKSVSNAPWFLTTNELHDNLQMTTVKEEIKRFEKSYKDRLVNHPNPLATQLLQPSYTKRLKRRCILNIKERQ